MNIKISGCNPHKIKYISNKIEKYLDLLGLLKHVDDKFIEINFVKYNKFINNKTHGAIMSPIIRRVGHKPDMEYTLIYINRDTLKNRKHLLTTLMHELVHFKQFITLKLKWVQHTDSCAIQAFWKKKKFGKFDDLSRESLPWEKEADEIEEQMWKEGKL